MIVYWKKIHEDTNCKNMGLSKWQNVVFFFCVFCVHSSNPSSTASDGPGSSSSTPTSASVRPKGQAKSASLSQSARASDMPSSVSDGDHRPT